MDLEPKNPVGSYKFFDLLRAVPVAIPLFFYIKVMQLTARRPLPKGDWSSLPPNALIYGYHRLFYFFHSVAGGTRKSDPKVWWMGYHGFASYFPFLLALTNRYHFYRFRMVKDPRPLQQTLAFLHTIPDERFGLLTDAGGPYHRVRPSIYDMVQATGRPVVAIAMEADRYFKIGNHLIPLPFCKFEIRMSRVIPPGELLALGRERATELLQRVVDELNGI